MRKIFITLILMLSVFSIANAHPFKTEKELDNFFSQIDKRIKEELKKNYREEYSKRKISVDNEYSFEIEDEGTSFFTRNIDMKPKTEITQYFNKKGELYMISSLLVKLIKSFMPYTESMIKMEIFLFILMLLMEKIQIKFTIVMEN